MKKQLLLFYFILFVSLFAQAQLNGNGYYRIKNRDTQRYLTIVDDKASVNIATTEPDLAAILPIRNFDRIVGNPGSIIYIQDAGSGNYVLSAQNVNTYNLVGEYLKLRKMNDGSYYAYASAKGMTKYLCDEQSSYDEGWLMTGTTLRNWNIIPVNSESENYFAAVPEYEYNGNFYTTMYASFSYKAKNTNTELYYVAYIAKNAAVIKKLEASGVVPALSPIVIKSSKSDYASNKLDVVSSGASALSGNLLRGVLFNNGNNKHLNRVAYDPNTMRVLGLTKDGSIGFVTADIDYLPANKAYLVVPAGSPSELKMVTEDELSQLPDEDVPSDVYNIHIGEQSFTAGVDAVLPIHLKNTKEIKSFEFELSLPKGMIVRQGQQGQYLVDINDKRISNYSLETKISNTGNLIVSVVSASNHEIKADSGLIANIGLSVNRNIKVGEHTIAIKNIVLNKLDNSSSISVSDTTSVINVIPYEQGNTILYASELNVNAGVGAVLPIYMRNTNEVSSLEFEIALPQGISSKLDAQGNCLVSLNNAYANTHSVSTRKADNGNTIVSVNPKNGSVITPTTGIVAYIPLDVDKNVSLGQHTLFVKNISIVEVNGGKVSIPEVISIINAQSFEQASTMLYALEHSVTAGTESVLPIYLRNAEDVTSFEFEITLPQGIGIKTDANAKHIVTMSSSYSDTHVLNTKVLGNGNVLVTATSQNSATIKPNEGVIVNITLGIDKNVTIGQHVIALRNISIAKANSTHNVNIPENTSVINTVPFEQGEVIVYTENLSARAGYEFKYPIYLKNKEKVTSFELELCLPEGFNVKIDENNNYVIHIERSSSHNIVATQLDNGNLKVSSYSDSNAPFEGEDGVLAYVTIQVDENLSLGQYSIGLKNVVLTVPEKNNVTIPYIESFVEVKEPLLGDVNRDGHINIEDVYYIIKLWLGDSVTYSYKREDINTDGKFNVVDISAIINIILGNHADDSEGTASGDYSSMTTERISINPGQTIDVPVQFSNSGIDFISAEFDLYLPEGVEIATLANNKPAITAGSRLTDHEIITRKNTDGSIKIAVYSLTNSVFAKQEGDILILSLRATADAEEGLYALELNNQVLATTDIRAMKADDHLTIVNITKETRIDELNQTIDTKVVYDLQGRRSSVKQHGVYIVNGKKVIK
jgi:hypothetical protein